MLVKWLMQSTRPRRKHYQVSSEIHYEQMHQKLQCQLWYLVESSQVFSSIKSPSLVFIQLDDNATIGINNNQSITTRKKLPMVPTATCSDATLIEIPTSSLESERFSDGSDNKSHGTTTRPSSLLIDAHRLLWMATGRFHKMCLSKRSSNVLQVLLKWNSPQARRGNKSFYIQQSA